MKPTYEELESQLAVLAAELSAIDAIHNDAVFITDDHYEQCPPEVQKIIGALAVLQIPAYQSFLAEVRNEAGARAVELFAQTLGSPYAVRDEKCYEDGFTRAIEVVRDVQAPRYAAHIRKGVQS
ncbi:hypothetical protein I5403_11865 [Citrobacter farmeri]|uniref:hypothetical protein n=1 Tax=Citrobacter farmeri TaxID=67824 RepID=UPI001923C468|nr:hypothetical protein [Citrobacter farmeri]MBJ8746016.1 hypothetical protein [Citrobacter farmeri]MBJ8759267.1 hypothetical protein [Citrobacter farmeri]